MKLFVLLRPLIMFSVWILLLQATAWADPAEGSRRDRRMRSQQPAVVNNPAPAAVQAPLPQASGDQGYGFSKENPIKLGSPDPYEGPTMSQVYLRRLRDTANQPLRYERIGNVGPGADGHIVDKYRLIGSNGVEYLIYIDMYHPELNPLTLSAPNGLGIMP